MQLEMIAPASLHGELESAGVNFCVGVPDSVLRYFCDFLCGLPAEKHMIAANEGCAIGIAAGVQLAKGGVPLVYLQNSGLGNAVNPLVSLADPEVYAIPLVLMIGWRGEPNRHDEPQHLVQGRISTALLDTLRVPWRVLSKDFSEAAVTALWAVRCAKERGGPTAILVCKETFDKQPYEAPSTNSKPLESWLSREAAIQHILDALPLNAVIVSSTGKISRELYECRLKRQQSHVADFLTVGSMGHSSQIALGIALARSDQLVVCIDGDGAALMHMGGIATIGAHAPPNFVHVLLNNGVHDSVGGHPTVAFQIHFTTVAKACDYRIVKGPLTSGNQIRRALQVVASGSSGPIFVEIQIKPGARKDLGRPARSPIQSKQLFVARMKSLE